MIWRILAIALVKESITELTVVTTVVAAVEATVLAVACLTIARLAVARLAIADHFGVSATEVVFTSGATEANNLAIKGLVKAAFIPISKQNCLLSGLPCAVRPTMGTLAFPILLSYFRMALVTSSISPRGM